MRASRRPPRLGEAATAKNTKVDPNREERNKTVQKFGFFRQSAWNKLEHEKKNESTFSNNRWIDENIQK